MRVGTKILPDSWLKGYCCYIATGKSLFEKAYTKEWFLKKL
jgi:hypothetical protein